MTSVWKTKVLPGLNKIFDKDGKKAAAAEFLKSFNKVHNNISRGASSDDRRPFLLCIFNSFCSPITYVLINLFVVYLICRRRLARRLRTRRQSWSPRLWRLMKHLLLKLR